MSRDIRDNKSRRDKKFFYARASQNPWAVALFSKSVGYLYPRFVPLMSTVHAVRLANGESPRAAKLAGSGIRQDKVRQRRYVARASRRYALPACGCNDPSDLCPAWPCRSRTIDQLAAWHGLDLGDLYSVLKLLIGSVLETNKIPYYENSYYVSSIHRDMPEVSMRRCLSLSLFYCQLNRGLIKEIREPLGDESILCN